MREPHTSYSPIKQAVVIAKYESKILRLKSWKSFNSLLCCSSCVLYERLLFYFVYLSQANYTFKYYVISFCRVLCKKFIVYD